MATLDMSHQETCRLVAHLEEMLEGYTLPGPVGEATSSAGASCQWLPVEHMGNMLCHELGYEDQPEFEDACQGSFSDFLDKLPRLNKKVEHGKTYFQLTPEPPRDQWRAVKMTVKVSDTSDLWRVCLKSPHAHIEVPELEFEICADGKRRTDSIYNHISSAVYNLGMYARQAHTGLSDDHKSKIMDTVVALNCCLNVSQPWTWVVHDPSGLSVLQPMDEGVQLEYLDHQQPGDPPVCDKQLQPQDPLEQPQEQ